LNLDEMEDKDVYDYLHKAGLVEKLTNTEEWKVLKEAGERIVDRALTEFALKTKADDLTRIIELQTTIRKYKFGLFNEVELLKQNSELLFKEARERGLIGEEWKES
jgi:hypothetical protein